MEQVNWLFCSKVGRNLDVPFVVRKLFKYFYLFLLWLNIIELLAVIMHVFKSG
jgi:hypothetical protein